MGSLTVKLPKDVDRIITTLEYAGYEAYAVGGCVRDSILGRQPQDWDITTSAKPEQIKKLFSRTIDTGIQHGTVTVMLHHTGYEVTTYRVDGQYEDNRHPKSVEYTNSLRLDLERRDFTINAMAYNKTKGLVDAFGGIEDLHHKIIRCVGNPGERFDEDALRMLRAIRFSGQLGFQIEEHTLRAITKRAPYIQNISAERIRVELTKLLISQNAGQIRTAYQTGMTQFFLPELDAMMTLEQKNPHHLYTVGEHSIRSVEMMNRFFDSRDACLKDSGLSLGTAAGHSAQIAELTASLLPKQRVILCVTMLLHDIGKTETMTTDVEGIGHFYGHPHVSEKMAVKRMKCLTFDNETIDMVKRLVRWHDYRFGTTEAAMRRAMAKIGRDAMPLLFLVQYSDILSQNPDTFLEKLSGLSQSIFFWKKVLASKAALSLRELTVTGKDLLALGMQPGPEIGKILNHVLEYVIENPQKNEKDTLLQYIREQMPEMGGK